MIDFWKAVRFVVFFVALIVFVLVCSGSLDDESVTPFCNNMLLLSSAGCVYWIVRYKDD